MGSEAFFKLLPHFPGVNELSHRNENATLCFLNEFKTTTVNKTIANKQYFMGYTVRGYQWMKGNRCADIIIVYCFLCNSLAAPIWWQTRCNKQNLKHDTCNKQQQQSERATYARWSRVKMSSTFPISILLCVTKKYVKKLVKLPKVN